MTHRVEIKTIARYMLAIDTARHLAMGGFLFFLSDLFNIASYETTRQIAPLKVWGLAFMAVGLFCLFALVRRSSADLVRYGFMASAIMTGIWTSVFISSIFFYGLGGIRLVIPNLGWLMVDLLFVRVSLLSRGHRE